MLNAKSVPGYKQGTYPGTSPKMYPLKGVHLYPGTTSKTIYLQGIFGTLDVHHSLAQSYHVPRAHRSHRWGHRFESCCDYHIPSSERLRDSYFSGIMSWASNS